MTDQEMEELFVSMSKIAMVAQGDLQSVVASIRWSLGDRILHCNLKIYGKPPIRVSHVVLPYSAASFLVESKTWLEYQMGQVEHKLAQFVGFPSRAFTWTPWDPLVFWER